MSKSRYYTPEIEELYIGFELEHKNLMQENVWKKEIVDSDMWGIAYSTYEETFEDFSDEIRVKYLDKEDIESLGFTFDKTSIKSQWKFFKNNIGLVYRPETKELGTFTLDPSKNHFYSKHSFDNKSVSFLIIKNKSELKKLLKQLNIK